MPVPISLRKNFGESGYADVRIGKASIRIMFKSGTGYEVGVDQWDAAHSAGTYNLTMSKDGTKILGVRPIAGTYIFEFVELGNKINGVPELKKVQGGPRQSKDGSKKWFQPDTMGWVVMMEVQSEGKYKGLKVYNNIPYIFSPIPGSPYSQLQGSKNELERVETFLRVVGFDLLSNDIPFSVNVLPWMEKKLLEVRRPFLGTVDEKGFVNNLAELPSELAPKKKKGKK
jgi:hypothetical protein